MDGANKMFKLLEINNRLESGWRELEVGMEWK